MTERIWYYQIAGEAMGPVSREDLVGFLRTGRIDQFTPVRRGPDGKWIQVSQVQGLAAESAVPTRPKPPKPVPKPDTPAFTPVEAGRTGGVNQFDLLLIGWTRLVSYILIAILACAGVFFLIICVLSLLPADPVEAVRLDAVRPPESASLPSADEPIRPERLTTLRGVPISGTLQPYFNGPNSLLTSFMSATSDLDAASDVQFIAMMEDFATELETSDLKPRDRFQAMDSYFFRQSSAFAEHRDKIADRESQRSEAFTLLWAVVGTSVLVSLVLVLIRIEANTRPR